MRELMTESESESVHKLLAFLMSVGDGETARALGEELGVLDFGGSHLAAQKTTTPFSGTGLTHLQIKSLDEVLLGFDPIMERVAARIRWSGWLKDIASVVTILSSGGTVFLASGHVTATATCGAIAMITTLASFLATRLNGQDANLSGNFAKIAVKLAEAKLLREELKIYLEPGIDKARVVRALARSEALVDDLIHFKALYKIS